MVQRDGAAVVSKNPEFKLNFTKVHTCLRNVTSLSVEINSQDSKKRTLEGTSVAATPGGVLMPDSLTTIAVRHSESTHLLPSEGPWKPPFGCGCGKCTFFSFIERSCPTPIPSASSFPYLDVSELNCEQQQYLMTKLRVESEKIMFRFQELVSATMESLIQRKISHYKLVAHIMTLGSLKPVFKIPTLPAFFIRLKGLLTANTIYEIFLVLKDYFSFFNYHILEHIIKELGTEEDKAKLQMYIDDFNQYAKRRIFECQPEFGPVSDTDHADIFVKLDSHYDNYTVAQIEGFCHNLSEILNVSQGILRLCRIDKGCFLLMFQLPSFVQHKVFPLSRGQVRALVAIGVIRLTCGDYQFLVKLFVSLHFLLWSFCYIIFHG